MGVVALLVSLAVVDTWRDKDERLSTRLEATISERDAALAQVDESRAEAVQAEQDAAAVVSDLEGQLEKTQSNLRTMTQQVDGVADREGAVAAAEAGLAAREAEVEAREAAVTNVEAERDANSFGTGTWLVGEDIAAGVYRSDGVDPGGQSCYWSITRAGSNGDIIDNDLVDGGRPTVTLSVGQEFESSRCGTWTRQP